MWWMQGCYFTWKTGTTWKNLEFDYLGKKTWKNLEFEKLRKIPEKTWSFEQ